MVSTEDRLVSMIKFTIKGVKETLYGSKNEINTNLENVRIIFACFLVFVFFIDVRNCFLQTFLALRLGEFFI